VLSPGQSRFPPNEVFNRTLQGQGWVLGRMMVIEYRFRGPDSGFTGRGEGPLIATALTDVLADGLSMVYSFYDPDYSDRSLGTLMILDHINRARRMGLTGRDE